MLIHAGPGDVTDERSVPNHQGLEIIQIPELLYLLSDLQHSGSSSR